MPSTRTARRGDTVAVRNAKGKFRNGTVIADTKAISVAPATSTAATGGTVADGTQSYKVTFVVNGVESAPSPAKTQVTAGGGLSTVTVDVTAIPYPPNATTWKLYGRSSGTELLMTTVTLPTKTFIDTGSITPAGALPTDTGNISVLMFSEPNKTNIAKTTTYKATNVYYNR